MTPQERQILTNFLDRLVQVRDIAKDRDADELIAEAVARQPDAAYLLVQRALLQDQALQAAQAELAELRSRLQETQGARSFLNTSHGWGRSALRPRLTEPFPDTYTHSPANAGFGRTRASLSGSSFLGNAAAAAVGAMGGAFLYQGIENLFGRDDDADASQRELFDAPGEGDPGWGLFDDAPMDGGNDLASSAGIDDIGIDDSGFGADDGDGMNPL